MGRKRKADTTDLDYADTASGSNAVAGNSDMTASQTATSSRARKQKKTEAEPTEKRLARFRASCPKNIQERVERVRSQRFFMIERSREPDALCETFKVLGSTGNVYTVTVQQLPTCDCPDSQKGNHCKHLIFVMLKVLNVKEYSGFHYQKALLTSELATIFAEAPAAPTAAATQRLKAAYAEATGKTLSPEEQNAVGGRRSVDGEDCPVCYDEMKGKTEADLADIVFCETCQNGLHAECFKMWAMRPPVTCVYCRTPWVAPMDGAGGAAQMDGGYLNLAGVAGVSRVRDTSTYYHGSARGYWKRRYNS